MTHQLTRERSELSPVDGVDVRVFGEQLSGLNAGHFGERPAAQLHQRPNRSLSIPPAPADEIQ